MIPTIFEACGRSLETDPETMDDAERRDWSRVISGVGIGLVAGTGALGGVGINLALRASYLSTGTVTSAFWVFMLFYAAAAVLTWKTYVRRPAPVTGPVLRTAAKSRPPDQSDRFSGCSISA
jgi:MFS transporter, NNP family, nitrate/nitrite transporter